VVPSAPAAVSMAVRSLLEGRRGADTLLRLAFAPFIMMVMAKAGSLRLRQRDRISIMVSFQQMMFSFLSPRLSFLSLLYLFLFFFIYRFIHFGFPIIQGNP
jgi:hypothetical protein